MRTQPASDLRRQDEVVAIALPKRGAEPVLAKAPRIKRRGVEIAEAALVRVRQHVLGAAFLAHRKQAAAAITECRQRRSRPVCAHFRSGRRPVLRPPRATRSCTSAAARLSAAAGVLLPMMHSFSRSDTIDDICAASGITAYIFATFEFSDCALRKRNFGSRARSVLPRSTRTGTAP